MIDDGHGLVDDVDAFDEIGVQLEPATIKDPCRAKKTVISKENSTLIDGAVDGDGAGDADAIQARTTQIKARIEETSSDYDRRKPQERMANPAGGSARHQGRASTEIEIEEKVLRVEVALNVTRAVS